MTDQRNFPVDGERYHVRRVSDPATGEVIYYYRTDTSKALSDNTGWVKGLLLEAAVKEDEK